MPGTVVDILRDNLARETEERLRDTIPRQIRELEDRVRAFDLNVALKKIKTETENLLQTCAKMAQGNGSQTPGTRLQIPTEANNALEEAYQIIKPYILKLIDDTQILRMWILMNIPRIEDGNNFGVAVQEEVVMETNKMELDGIGMLDYYGDYLMYRAKLVSKMCKWPAIGEYRRAIAEADEGAYLRFRLNLREVRNYYARMFDIYQKNSTKLRNPRSETGSQINFLY